MACRTSQTLAMTPRVVGGHGESGLLNCGSPGRRDTLAPLLRRHRFWRHLDPSVFFYDVFERPAGTTCYELFHETY